MSKPRATNLSRWSRRTGSKINTLCRSILNFRRSKTHPVRLKTRRRRNILTVINKNLVLSSKYSKKRRLWSRGFILPTITMVLMVFSLVVSSILLRTSQSTQATIGSRESDVTYNLATPAVERAKSKIEFLFKRDYRYPNAIPAEETLERLMLNQKLSEQTQTDKIDPYLNELEEYEDIYKLPDESRIDIDQDNVVDNAWVYDTDIDGDGNPETVVYSILMTTSRDGITVETSSDEDKAANLVTRTGPLTLLSGKSTSDCSFGTQNTEGWYPINTATLRKNFQVNAVVVKKNEAIRTVSSIEFQQDRQLDKGNKWGVWFRYDLEAYPGPDFNFNGAMHTEGNLIWGDAGGEGINTYLISSPESCLYTEDASEITLSQVETQKGKITFQGQILNGNPTFNNYDGKSEIDIFPGSGTAPGLGTKGIALTKGSDSITDSLQTNSPYQFSLDPISVFTKDVSESRYSDKTNRTIRATNWNTSKLHERLFNKLIRRPYVDDTYRADDRWGPKPVYNSTIAVPNGKYGEPITGKYSEELIKENPPSSHPEQVGLDGYWERRARVEGLRIITGQRLELGNAFGWKGNNDSLYPPSSTTLKNLDRQRRSGRDNLAAVQSTLLYHYNNDKDFPIATLATTVHPGTVKTRDKATTFTNLPYKYKNEALAIPDIVEKDHVNTDFLTGEGTNGWEFNAPGNVANQTEFATIIEDSSHPLRIALDNLARFAGDPNGAFPPIAETSTINPYPYLSMWGDFSELRRALSLITPTTGYAELSIADRTTLQTAAATLGLLAYNINNVNEIYKQLKDDSTAGMEALGGYFWTLMDGVSNSSNPEIAALPNSSKYSRTEDKDSNGIFDSVEFYNKFVPEQYLRSFSNMASLPTATKNELIAKARNLMLYAQVERDRFLGFQKGAVLTSGKKDSAWSKTFTDADPKNDGIVQIPEGSKFVRFKTACDPESFINVDLDSPAKDAATLTKKRKAIALATAFCSNHLDAMTPKYPSLYYLFPKFNHNYKGTLDLTGTTDNDIKPENLSSTLTAVQKAKFNEIDNQPTTEPYINNTYIGSSSVAEVSSSPLFKVLNNTNSEAGIAAIALQPRALADWKIPKIISASDPDIAGASGDMINKIVVYDSSNTKSFVRIPFLDKAFYDGRQLMQVRSLDIDLKMLRDNSVGTDTWLTKSGIIYAFREDARREDAIARPAGTTFAQCDTEAKLYTDSCRMKVNTPQDPPNNNKTGVSLKPVDFYPDPDRRPHSFRLKNGVDISRSGTTFGVSFISDDPIYIQGDLNLHQDHSGKLLEEFTQKLDDDWDNFYTRSTRDTSFAKASSDKWRPVEILGDALTVLSKNFCDGTFEDGMLKTSTNCPSSRTSSYLNSTLANSGSSSWKRENSNDPSDNSPILVDQNAQIFLSTSSTPFTNYRTLESAKDINNATNTNMNAMFINGLVPSRPYQSYGGLHNFPRLIEDWKNDDLKIFGAFIQLKFSTYATAPWDQEAWEPGENPKNDIAIPYYSPPNRRWGYDVALQYAPPGPIASRFVSVGSPRNEFYEQLSADDPYTKQLRCAKVNGNPIDSKATDCT